VTNMIGMFQNCTIFNQNINAWNVSSVTDMTSMFESASAFNADISLWNVGAVGVMTFMFFNNLVFNQSLGGWNIANVTDMNGMMTGCAAYSTIKYDGILTGWSALNVQSGVQFDMNATTKFSQGAAGTRGILTSAPNNWTITDGGQV